MAPLVSHRPWSHLPIIFKIFEDELFHHTTTHCHIPYYISHNGSRCELRSYNKSKTSCSLTIFTIFRAVLRQSGFSLVRYRLRLYSAFDDNLRVQFVFMLSFTSVEIGTPGAWRFSKGIPVRISLCNLEASRYRIRKEDIAPRKIL